MRRSIYVPKHGSTCKIIVAYPRKIFLVEYLELRTLTRLFNELKIVRVWNTRLNIIRFMASIDLDIRDPSLVDELGKPHKNITNILANKINEEVL